MDNISDTLQNAKDKMPNLTPTPPKFKEHSSAQDLKARLEWGEPALTIIDVRDREAFNNGRILGAISMPLDTLVDRVRGALEPVRDIYLYGADESQTAQAVSQLRTAGFRNVAEIKGGLEGWKAVGGPTEGIQENGNLGAGEYNVVSRMATQERTQKAAKNQ